MQTRRKSLNLGDLGVVAPKRSRTASHPSPPATVVEGEEPPVKKSKRSHGSESPPLGLMSPPRTTTIRTKEERRKPAVELSPPPSPLAEGAHQVDTEGINDDIVVGTIHQLERTGNRPHLVKELAAVLATNLHAVEKSANPSALISSRLTAYLHRSWPAISPCPLAKDLSPVHPRRLYFYLTTSPHQPIPEVAAPLPKPNRIISPSLSSASAIDEEDRYSRNRQVLSPSPEVDLSSPELDEDHGDADPPTPGNSFSGRSSVQREHSSYTHNNRRASPPLETEERDFKQTASVLLEQAQARRRSSSQDVNMDFSNGHDAVAGAESDHQNGTTTTISTSIETDESEESAHLKNGEAAIALFGGAHHLHVSSESKLQMAFISSPLLQPETMRDRTDGVTSPMKTESHRRHDLHDADIAEAMHLDIGVDDDMLFPDASFALDNLQSPENVELTELEDLFDAY